MKNNNNSNRHRNTDMNSAASQRASLNYNEVSQQKRSDDKKATKRNVKAVNNQPFQLIVNEDLHNETLEKIILKEEDQDLVSFIRNLSDYQVSIRGAFACEIKGNPYVMKHPMPAEPDFNGLNADIKKLRTADYQNAKTQNSKEVDDLHNARVMIITDTLNL